MPYFGTTDAPCFGFLVISPLRFKTRVDSPYLHCGGKCNVHSLRSTSGVR